MYKSMVYLVGAGPGDPGLITVKGLECIQKADVIIYDRLIGQNLLTHAKSDVELIFAGKGPNRQVLKQHEINNLLVDKAKEGKIVVRLKGGDPFIFGRGGEEAEFLKENDIPFEIVPGITSATAVPAYAGIPVTHRNIASSFIVITGNEDPAKGNSNIQWDKISTDIGTLVFLMGMGNLPEIVDKLIENECPKDTPIALISWGTRPRQQTLVGTLENIIVKRDKAMFKNPAVIIVGKVVKMREKLKWFESKPLFGKRVLVTRPENQAGEFSKRIEELGGEPYEFPTIKISEADNSGLDKAIMKVNQYNWIIFTSVNGVQYFFKRLFKLGKDVRVLQNASLCAIGPKTKQALEEKGLIADYVPDEYRAEAIITGLKHKIKSDDKILLPRSDNARKILPDTLKEIGAQVDDVVAYKTKKSDANADLLHQMMLNNEIQIITFTSSSTVQNFVELLRLPQRELASLLNSVCVASIGPITTATAREMGIKVDVEAAEYTIEGLIDAIIRPSYIRHIREV
ncbi:MAG: uroporphyrinogen-III C-methyltransferase [Actinobacteria bacterium]|nr:uroporphyrinogen-III C-methyltransferase [Actinomycetota bacterium]